MAEYTELPSEQPQEASAKKLGDPYTPKDVQVIADVLGVSQLQLPTSDEYMFFALDVRACFPPGKDGFCEAFYEARLRHEQNLLPTKLSGWCHVTSGSGMDSFISDPALLRSLGCITDHEILQLALLNLEPFQTHSDQVFDLRNGHHYPRACKDRRQLIATLADAFVIFDRSLRGISRGPEVMRDNFLHAIATIGPVLQYFVENRDRIRPPEHSPLRWKESKQILKEGVGIAAHVFQALSPGDFARMFRSLQNTSYNELLACMHKAFINYGPKTNYPNEAIYEVLSALLTRLVVKGIFNLSTTPGAIQRRLNRSARRSRGQ